MDWNYIIAAATTLFVVLDPLGNAPIVQSILDGVEPRKRTRILIRELFVVLVLLLVFFFLGRTVLDYLGITESSLRLSGGIMLFLIAVGMVFPGTSGIANNGAGEEPRSYEPFIVPVAVPLIVGPAAISLVMMQSSLCDSAIAMGTQVLSIVLAWVATAIPLIFSGKILGYLGSKGTVALTRLMGTILVLISVQMILDGITQYVGALEDAPAAPAPAADATPSGQEAPAAHE